MTNYEREVTRRMPTLRRRFDWRGDPVKPEPTPEPAPTPKHTVFVPIGLRAATDESGKPLEVLIREKVEAYAAGRQVSNLSSRVVFVDEENQPVPGFQQATHRVVVVEFNATQVQPEPDPAPAADVEVVRDATGTVVARIEPEPVADKPTTVVLHAEDASLESPEDALQRGLREVEERRRRAVRRPGPTRW